MRTQPPTDGTKPQADSWKSARKLTERLGYIPTSFTVAIRTLLSDHFKNDSSLRPLTKYQVARIFATPSFKSMLYYASKDLRGKYITPGKALSVGTMMDMFTPFDLAAMIAAFMYYRKCRKLLGEKWPTIYPQLNIESQLGSHFGLSLPIVGMSLGLFMGTLHHFARAAMFLADEKEFTKYLRTLKNEGQLTNEASERSIWGCSVPEVAALLLSNTGVSADVAEALTRAYDPSLPVSTGEANLAVKFRISRLWIEALSRGETNLAGRMPPKYYPMTNDLVVLQEATRHSLAPGSRTWLDRVKDDILPSKVPELYAAGTTDEDIPEQLRAVFNIEDITRMQEEDFDDLIDQIDDEQAGKKGKNQIHFSTAELKELEQAVD